MVRMTQSHQATFIGDRAQFRPSAPSAPSVPLTEPYWVDSALESVLRDVDDTVILKIRPLAAGGVSARWTNGREWDLSDLDQKGPQYSSVRWFETLRLAKAAAANYLRIAA